MRAGALGGPAAEATGGTRVGWARAAGVEGVMRRSCEETLRVLRAAKASLLTIVEVFIHDPLYKWALTPADARARQLAGSPGVRVPPAPPAPAPLRAVQCCAPGPRALAWQRRRARPAACQCVRPHASRPGGVVTSDDVHQVLRSAQAS